MDKTQAEVIVSFVKTSACISEDMQYVHQCAHYHSGKPTPQEWHNPNSNDINSVRFSNYVQFRIKKRNVSCEQIRL